MGGGGRRSRGPRPEPRDYAGEAENARKAAEARAEEDMSRLREQQAAHQKEMAKMLEAVNKPKPYTPAAMKIGSTTGDTKTGLSRKDRTAKSKRSFRPRDTKIALKPGAGGANVGGTTAQTNV